MINRVWAQSRVLDRQSAQPRHFYGSPAAIPCLLAVCDSLLIWFGMEIHLAVCVVGFLIWSSMQHLRESVPSRLSADQRGGQTKAAFDALVTSMGEQIAEQKLPLILVRPFASDSSDTDDEGDQQLRVITVRIDQYPSVTKLVATNALVIDDKSMSRLRNMVCPLPKAACAEKWRHIIQGDASRFSSVIQSSWVLHKYPDAFADCHELTKESTKNWVCKLKITTRLLCLMRCQLDEQDWLCQNLKEDYFAEVAGPYIKVLLEVASAFSSASWTTGDVSNMVPIFEAFLDSLCNIKQSLSRDDLLHVNVADIFRKVVNAFKVIIGGSENDLQISEECAIMSATYYLIVALEFFYRNRNVQPILASADSGYTIDICNCWISKVKEDGKRLFPDEGDRQYIFILTNMYFVWEKKCQGQGFLSVETLNDWFKTLIEKYIGMYVVEYWVPLGQFWREDPLSFWEFFGIWASIPLRLSADQLGGVLSVDQTKAAFDALVASMGKQILEPLILVRHGASDSSVADDEGDDTVRIDQYPSVAKLVATNARVIDDKSMSLLQKMVWTLPKAACSEKWRHIIQVDASRFSNVIQSSWVLHKYPDAFADCHELTKESTKNWVCKLKITTRLLCLMRCQLDEQDWLCQKLKEDYFAEVAGPYIKVLLEVASAFSSASWTTGDVSNMVPIFEAFLDSLCNIKQSLSRDDRLHVNVADIFRKVVNAFKVIIGGSENDLQISEECAIMSATYYLIVALEFFYRNRNVQPILASADSGYTIDICNCWISKVKEDGKRLFPDEGDYQYIFILTNMYFVWEKKCQGEGFLSVETLNNWFKTLIEKYMGMYVECWVPLGQYIQGDYLKKPCHSYLFTFIKEFNKKYIHQRKWKVLQPELRNTLRRKIAILLVGPYDNFLASLVAAGPSSESFDKKIMRTISNNDSAGIKVYPVAVFANEIQNLFEGGSCCI